MSWPMNRPADHSLWELEGQRPRHSHGLWRHRHVMVTAHMRHEFRFFPNLTRIWYRWLHYCAMNWAEMPEMRAASIRLSGTLLTWRNMLPPE